MRTAFQLQLQLGIDPYPQLELDFSALSASDEPDQLDSDPNQLELEL